MNVLTVHRGPIPAAKQWVYGLWMFYRHYTHSAIHAASAAALTIFGLLVFIDPLFAAVAIAAYVCPPLVLYVLDVEPKVGSARSTPANERTPTNSTTVTVPTTSSGSGEIDIDSDGDDGDTDSDDGDTDSDGDDGDTDTDT